MPITEDADESEKLYHVEELHQIAGHIEQFRIYNGHIAKRSCRSERSNYHILYEGCNDIKKFVARYCGSLIIDSPTSEVMFLHLNSEHDDSDIDIIHDGEMSPIEDSTEENRFIILRDLECHFEKVCSLDIKLGIRTYWVDAPPEKVHSHTITCLNTTSGSIGMRLCGMKVFFPFTNKWIQKGKSWGRSLSCDELSSVLALFLSDGVHLADELIDNLLNKLRDIRSVIKKSHWRFWSSSIFIVRDGYKTQEVTANLIDFANCDFAKEYSTPDNGYLLGLNNLIATIELIKIGYIKPISPDMIM